MALAKKIQAAGDWSLKLRDDTPPSVTNDVGLLRNGFSSLVVTPAWFAEPDQVDLAFSVYTGVLRTQANRVELGGEHASIWLGDEDSKGNLPGAVTANQGMVAWVNEILDWTPLTAGTLTAPSGTWLDWTWGGVLGEETSPREALDYVCSAYGVEWRVNDDLTVDVATRANLYGTPSTIFSRRWSGRDYGYRSVRAAMSLAEDLEDYGTRAVVVWDDAGTPTATGADGPATPYTAPDGSTLVMKRKVDSSDTKDLTGAGWIASAEAERFGKIRQNVTLDTDHRVVMHDLRCGEYAYLWDPEQGVMDTDRQVQFRGHVLFPLMSRIVGLSMSIEKGLGVYLRRGDGSVVDLTPWVAWESPGAEIEVGAFAPSLAQAMRRRGLRRRS